LNEVNFEGYETEQALRQQVERTSRRSLTDEEWAQVSRDRFPTCDDLDVAEIGAAMRDTLPERPKLSQEEKAQRYRLAHRQRAALDAREMVEDFRTQIFDGKMPPFPEDATAATKWIEEQESPLQTMRLELKVTVPAAEAGIQALIYLRDLLNQQLPENPPIPEDPQAFHQLLDRSDFINHLSFSQPPPLEYLGVNPQGEHGIIRISAPDGTLRITVPS